MSADFIKFNKYFFKFNKIGAHSAGETPDTIPNSEAKPSSGDYTSSGKIARCRLIQMTSSKEEVFVFRI
jgi:hypothetical protein